jgi:diguanylate cyclase (GGDEF)-like protein
MPLLNRRDFEQRLADVLARTLPLQEHALLYLSVDGLEHGADADLPARAALQQAVIAVAQSTLRPGDVTAQLESGEFALLLTDCSEDQALQTARLLRLALEHMRFQQTKTVTFGFNIGIATVAWGQIDAMAILANARRACHRAKTMGYDSIELYQPSSNG